MTLRAFLGDQAVKDRLIRLLRNPKALLGQSAGVLRAICNCSDFAAFETEFGIPKELAVLLDQLFITMDRADAITWLSKLIQAIPLSACLDSVWPQFGTYIAHWALERPIDDQERSALEPVVKLFESESTNPFEWDAAAFELRIAFGLEGARQTPAPCPQVGLAVLAAYANDPATAIVHMLAVATAVRPGVRRAPQEVARTRNKVSATFGDVVVELVSGLTAISVQADQADQANKADQVAA